MKKKTLFFSILLLFWLGAEIYGYWSDQLYLETQIILTHPLEFASSAQQIDKDSSGPAQADSMPNVETTETLPTQAEEAPSESLEFGETDTQQEGEDDKNEAGE